jgi:hypothetical protein
MQKLLAVLRPGTAHPNVGALGIVRRLIPALREAFPFAMVRVRLDGGFACPELCDFLDDERVEYLVGMAKNSVLSGMAQPSLDAATVAFEKCGETVSIYDDSWYAAKLWKYLRRVIHKAEIVSLPGRQPRESVRFVVTNLDLNAEQVWFSAPRWRRPAGRPSGRLRHAPTGASKARVGRLWMLGSTFMNNPG